MADLSVKIKDLKLKNPVMTASGTFGYGLEFADFVPQERLALLNVHRHTHQRVDERNRVGTLSLYRTGDVGNAGCQQINYTLLYIIGLLHVEESRS